MNTKIIYLNNNYSIKELSSYRLLKWLPAIAENDTETAAAMVAELKSRGYTPAQLVALLEADL